MFSFFAVPILLGDITIDFMQMIDVMVDVMVEVMEEEGEEGDGNNNNNNNNNNKKRRKRKKREQVVDLALESFENEPSNVTIIQVGCRDT